MSVSSIFSSIFIAFGMILDSPSLSDKLEPLPICGEVPVLGYTCKDVGVTVLALRSYAGGWSVIAGG